MSISRLLFQINNDQSAIQDLQKQLSTGRRIEKPSDDPASAVRALAAQRQIEFKEQTDRNLSSADTILSASEASLSQVQSIVNEMRGVAVEAAGTTLSDTERQALSNQVRGALERLAQIGNARIRDQYLFAGSDVSEFPIDYSGETVRFNGNADSLDTIGDFATLVTANVRADDAFGVKSDKIIGRVDLNPAISTSTPLDELNRGDGVRGGAISLSDGNQRVEIDLSTAHDLQDVIVEIESIQLSGRQLAVDVNSSGLTIRLMIMLAGYFESKTWAQGSWPMH